jgi:hypothetical protein
MHPDIGTGAILGLGLSLSLELVRWSSLLPGDTFFSHPKYSKPIYAYSSPVMNCALPFPKLRSAAEFVTIETMTSFGSMAQISFSSRQSSK